jgi:hypothetical protein
MIAAAPPPPAAADVLVVSRRDASEVVSVQDLPLVLTKGPQREQALVRRAIFVTAAVAVVRPQGAEGPAADRYRWTYQPFLQRQVCFTSMTGLFACSAAEVDPLADAERGEAPVDPANPESTPLAEAARARLSAALKLRAEALFDADRRANIDPRFRASGVTALKPGATPTPPAARRR